MIYKHHYLRKFLNTTFLIVSLYVLLNNIIAKNYIIPDRYPSGLPPENYLSTFIDCNGQKTPIWISKGLCSNYPKKSVFILVHGYKGNRAHWKEILDELSIKHEVVVVALRAHDTNSAAHTTFSTKEASDVSKVIDWAYAQYQDRTPKIILLGSSLGGVTSWKATELNSKVDGIISDSAFLTLTLSGDRWLEGTFYGGSIILKPMVWIAENLINVDTDKMSPIDSARKWAGKPAMVIHCEKDNIVYHEESKQIADAANAEFHVIKSAYHAKAHRSNKKEYLNLVESFAEKIN